MTLASENYRSGQPIFEYIQNNLAPHFSPDLINPQHFCHSARRKPVRLSKSGLTVVLDLVVLWLLWPSAAHGETMYFWQLGLRRGKVLAAALASLVPVLLVYPIATFPGER